MTSKMSHKEYLAFAAGDHVEVLDAPGEADGWSYGRHLESGA